MYVAPEIAAFVTDRFLLLVLALLVEAVVGEIAWLFRVVPHPRRMLQGLAAVLGRRLNREKRGPRDLVVRGTIVVLAVLGVAVGAGWAVAEFAATLRTGWAIELAGVVILLGQRGAYREALAVPRALARDGLSGGRHAVAAFGRTDSRGLDEHGLCRAAIERLAMGFLAGAAAPAFWYLLLGLPGLMFYIAAGALGSTIGGPGERFERFGVTAARLIEAADWIPARLAGLALAVASLFAPTAGPIQAWRAMWRDPRRRRGRDFPVAAMAGALALQLGGPKGVGGESHAATWIGTGDPRAVTRDVHRAGLLFGIACVVQALAIAALAVLRLAT